MTVMSGLRDYLVARRKKRLMSRRTSGDAAALVDALPARQHVLVTGATGFIGRRLVEALAERGPRRHRAHARSGKGGDVAAAAADRDRASRRSRTTRGSMP